MAASLAGIDCRLADLRGWLGGGNTARNTTIVRSNYRQPALHNLFEFSLKLWEGMSDDLNYNVMFSQRGAMFLGHSDSDMIRLAERGDAMRAAGIDAEFMTMDQLRKKLPLLDLSDKARYPIVGALNQPRGGTARHDAVAWGYARGADRRGVDLIQAACRRGGRQRCRRLFQSICGNVWWLRSRAAHHAAPQQLALVLGYRAPFAGARWPMRRVR